MARRAAPPELDPYRPLIETWVPKGELRRLARGPFEAVLAFDRGQGERRYLVEEKRHLRFQDAAVIADMMRRRRDALPPEQVGDGLLLLAPHVRIEHAAILERAGIDYIDLAGNAHLQAPGLMVHVEGRRPPKEPLRVPGRPHKAWVKTVMALLIKPELIEAPYRTIAEQADVALGTVVTCMDDLTRRRLISGDKTARAFFDRPALVALWVNAYTEVLRPKLREYRLQVRVAREQTRTDEKAEMVARLTEALGGRHVPWALTGADAAYLRTEYFWTALTEIYAPPGVFENRDLQRALVAQPSLREGNLLVIEPPGPLAIPAAGEGTPVAHDLLAYAELRFDSGDQALEAAEMMLPFVLNDVPR